MENVLNTICIQDTTDKGFSRFRKIFILIIVTKLHYSKEFIL